MIIRNAADGLLVDRLSPWATYVTQPTDLSYGNNYKQKIWHPPQHERYTFKHRSPKAPRSPRIYECHVGIATEKLEVGSYKNFAENVIPRIVKQGYNTIQVMAIMEVIIISFKILLSFSLFICIFSMHTMQVLVIKLPVSLLPPAVLEHPRI